MNILYLHTHDTGRYIEPYGHNIPTPNLMNLSKEGTLFRHAFSAAPTCSPSRTGLLTGMSPHSAGMLGLAHRGFQIDDYSKHLVQYLNKHGYETVLCGFQHEAPDKKMIGYQRFLDGEENISEREDHSHDLINARKVASFLENRKGEKPFFLSLGLTNTHRVFPDINNKIDPDYVMPPFPMYDTDETRRDMAKFISSAMIVDDCIGIVMEALEKSDLEDETMVIFTTDHGIAFPHMKCTLYDTGIGVSLIIKYPGNKSKGEAEDALVSHLDIFPTICDVAGIPKPDWLQGYSLLPLLEKKTDKIRDEIFAEVTFHAAYEPMRCIRTQRYKLIRYYDEHDNIVPANIDDSLSKSFLLENSYLQKKREKAYLFDLYLDPVERINLIEDERYQDIYDDLSTRLENWMEKTDDPLLKGKVKKPQGAIVNKLECLSPEEDNFE